MNAELAVCYVADLNFMLGTLVSLRSLRRFVPARKAEAYVFYLNPDPEVLQRVRRSLSKYDAEILPLRIEQHMDFAGKTWNRTHVPRSALGRFYIEPHLPSHVERILYIDGDTLVVRDPSELIGFVPPENGLAAADDISFFARNDWSRFGRQTRAYFAGLGIDGSAGYLNSGLLLANREAWRTVVAEAAAIFDRHSDKCKYHDQSALNAVLGRRRVRISPKWNFQTPFCYWNVRDEAQPCIFHFTEYPKPWMGDFAPWSFLQESIQQSMAEFSGLALPNQSLSAADVEKYNARNRELAQRLATRMPLRLFSRRRQFREAMVNSTI